MSDKPDLIAAAQVNAFSTPSPGIEFKSNFGFKTATRSSAGSYLLELDHSQERHELVVNVTRNNLLVGEIAASLPNEKHIQVNCFDSLGNGADSPFFIQVLRIS